MTDVLQRPCARSQSYVIRWAEQNMARVDDVQERDVTAELLFVGFINLLMTFCEPNPRYKAGTLEYDVRERFSNDAAFFELGCYVCARLDAWLQSNRPDLYQQIVQVFAREFFTLFSAAFQIPNVAQLAQQRMDIFALMGRSEPDVDQPYNPLIQLLLMTDGNAKPRSYVWGEEPVLGADFFEFRALQREVVGWIVGFLPGIIELVGTGADLISKHAGDRHAQGFVEANCAPVPVAYAPSGKQVRPWVRFLARLLDYALLGFLTGIVLAVVYPPAWRMLKGIAGIVLGFVYIFVEAAMLSAWGTTPGKALFKVRVRNRNGSMLSYAAALKRSFSVWSGGEALGIPILCLIAELYALNWLTKHGIAPWDEKGDFVVSHQVLGVWRVALVVLIFGFMFMIAL